MRKKRLYLNACCIFFLICVSSCTVQKEVTTIGWDKWGTPHITSASDKELFFAQGWSQMHLHGKLLLEMYGRARGKGAEYWGKDHIQDDVLVHTLGFPELAKQWRNTQDDKLKEMINSFVAGMNAYLVANPNTIDDMNRAVLPLEYDDVNLHYLYVVYTRFVASNELGFAHQWEKKGSNSYAIGPTRSKSGNAMLVQNPHLPWFGEFTFTETHLLTPSNNLYGATLVGLPGIQIGFNEQLGWSHTNNVIDNVDLYELDKRIDGYLLDGKITAFEKEIKTIKVLNDKGGFEDHEFVVLKSQHGPIVREGERHSLALRVVGFDRPNALLQWWHMGNATNFESFETALKMAQIPFWNVMYADKAGNIFYLFNGLIPIRKNQRWDYWSSVVKGGNSEDIWTSIHPYADLPKVKNPDQGWLQNANDPPWTCTFPMTLNPDDFPGYFSPRQMDFRPQRSVRMMREDSSISFDELVDYKLSTRLEMADRLLDDLFNAIDKYGTPLSRESKLLLKQWDMNADSASIGTLLFTEWAYAMKAWNPVIYKIQWSESNPLVTPDGLANPKQAVEVLDEVAGKIIAKHKRLNIPWGQVYRLKRDAINISGNGTSGFFGTYRVAWANIGEDSLQYIDGGDSWVGLIEFGEKVRAKVLLSYGNSSQPHSKHNGDQLQLFSKKQFRNALFYPKDISENIQKTEVIDVDKLLIRPSSN